MPKLFLSPWVQDFTGLEIPPNSSQIPIQSQSQVSSWISFLRNVGAGDPAVSSAQSVATKNGLAVISGQQIGLGIGPILSLYKIFAIENLAEHFSKILNQKVSPVFWLQTEDHDLAEILEMNFLDENFDFKTISSEEVLNIIGFGKDNRRSVGGISLTKFVPMIVSEIKEKFLKLRETHRFDKSYAQGENLTTSFANYFYSIFPDSKVAFFDIRNDAFKSFKTKVFLTALEKQEKIARLLEAQANLIKSSGRETQVHLRDSSPLFFYHPNGLDSDRFRLTKVKDNYFVEETGLQISEFELTEELKTKPEKFSSSALLRPLLQDSIFNTLCYVGGAAEISYLEQIEPLYNEFDVRMPMRLLRPSGMIVDEKSVKHFGDLGATDYFKGKDFLIDKLIDHEFQGDLNPDLLNSKIEENIDGIEKLLDQTLKVELTLTNPKLKTIDSVKRSVGRFMEKYRIALVRNESVLHGRINRLLSQTYPGNKLQERVISVYSFELLYGENVLSEIRSQFEEWFKNNVS